MARNRKGPWLELEKSPVPRYYAMHTHNRVRNERGLGAKMSP